MTVNLNETETKVVAAEEVDDKLGTPIKKAKLKRPLLCCHGTVERVSGKVSNITVNGKVMSVVRVHLLNGRSPNGQKEFFMDANERVNVLAYGPKK